MSRQVQIFEASFDPDVEPYPIQLKFTNVKTGEQTVHEFEAMGDPGIGGDLAVAAILRTDPDTGRRGVDLNGLLRFFNRVLLDDGYQRLEALLADQSVTIGQDMLFQVFTFLTGEYAGRPTSPSPSSRNGRRTTGATSTASSSSKA